MDTQHKELAKMHNEIVSDVRGIFEKNLTVFDWDIPENDDLESATLILELMKKELSAIENDIKEGKYTNY